MLRTLVIVLTALALSACSQKAIMAGYEPLQETQFAKESVEQLRTRNFDTVLTKLDPELRNNPEMAGTLPAAADYFPGGDPVSVKLVGYNFLTVYPAGGSASTNYTISFEYEFAAAWIVAVATLRNRNSETSLLGIRLFRNADSLENLNALTFRGKGAIHLLWTILGIGILAFIITTLIACIRTRVSKRKWLWIVFILFGLGQATLNWTTGEITFGAAVNLFGASLAKAPYGPWMFQLAFPLGAALFWWRRRAWVERSPADQFA